MFPHSVRGLKPGAAVEFLGFKVGEVVDMKLEFDVDNVEFKAPVLFFIEPERIHLHDESVIYPEGLISEMVRRGLRVQLKSGNLLTGQLYVDLVMQPDAKEQKIDYSLAHPLLPSVPSDVEALTSSVRSVLDDMKQIQFKRLGNDMHQTLTLLNSNLERTDSLFKDINAETLPQIDSALNSLQETMSALSKSVGDDSELNQDARMALAELAEAARAFKVLSEYLANHPESLIKGKDQKE
jgi:paraquat-inducible protein B